MIRINTLSRHYGNFKAVDDVSFEIQQGEVLGLLGHIYHFQTGVVKMFPDMCNNHFSGKEDNSGLRQPVEISTI